jgi:hypothetical protein
MRVEYGTILAKDRAALVEFCSNLPTVSLDGCRPDNMADLLQKIVDARPHDPTTEGNGRAIRVLVESLPSKHARAVSGRERTGEVVLADTLIWRRKLTCVFCIEFNGRYVIEILQNTPQRLTEIGVSVGIKWRRTSFR